DAVARGRAAVPWLADAAWVHQSRTLQTEGVHPVLVSDLTVSEPKYPRYMRMPVKANSAVEQLEVGVRDGGVEHVLVDVIARAGMDQEDVLFDVAVRESPQPFKPLVTDDLDRPANHGCGVVVEPLENFGVGAGAVVV